MQTKKKKVTKYRGHKTHGCGSMKKRRGAGNRGGRGRAGSGKKGDCKKPSYWKEQVGRNGFTSHSRTTLVPINVDELQNKVISLTLEGKLKQGKDGYELNLKELGYDKLLGRGQLSEKLIITVNFASSKAIEKVKTAGGKVTLPTSQA